MAQMVPQQCMVVGDTDADTQMGRHAQAGLIVGVLTGTGTEEFLLQQGADLVIPNISDLIVSPTDTTTTTRRTLQQFCDSIDEQTHR
mmetsp:Transcript_32816/g.35385  ORF Transcript_32816/g.35385 Transcript_32816/m.35385 type:complete len:87 (+) Transcript_32816:251-511(+)